MGFQFIVRKTLIDLASSKRVLGLVVVGILVPVIVALGWRSTLGDGDFSLAMEEYYVISNFLTISFIWIAGLFLAFVVSTYAAGFIAKESTDGTLLLLVSKPISRRQIVLGKLMALTIHVLLIEAITLLLFTALLRFMLPIETGLFINLLVTIPGILLYSLLVILVFGAISMCLSTLLQSQIKIMVSVAVIIALVFGLSFTSTAFSEGSSDDKSTCTSRTRVVMKSRIQ